MKFINPLLLIGMIGVFTTGSSLYADLMQVFYGDHSIYWTQKDSPLSLEKTGNNFLVFIGEKRLQDHLNGKTFFAADGELVPYPVLAKDVTVRVNNWPSVKAQILNKTIFTSFAFGVNLTLLIVGLVQVILRWRIKQGRKKGNSFK
ncbi:MAG: hypothetical protein D3915_07230 [Candidatus Electrothrix sp. AU1_5]|nr:hypothetical protein [Candidatus Electrothrix sp. AX1]MCI5182080.1 hypothetical protein [Candidatus Electrothrix gigas]MCI5192908.1 hypothetical protein [Candidatus Electrothrix gigas]